MVCRSAWGQGANIDFNEYINGAKQGNFNPSHDILSCNSARTASCSPTKEPISLLPFAALAPCLSDVWVETDLFKSAFNARCISDFHSFLFETNTHRERFCVNYMSGYWLPGIHA